MQNIDDEEYNDDYEHMHTVIIVALILVGCIFLLISVGIPTAKLWFNCTEEACATMSDVYVEDYLYAPFHGGQVTEKHRTHVSYVFDDGITKHTIHKTYPDLYNEYPTSIKIKYNPSNPNEFWFDNSMVSEDSDSKPEWVFNWNSIK